MLSARRCYRLAGLVKEWTERNGGVVGDQSRGKKKKTVKKKKKKRPLHNFFCFPWVSVLNALSISHCASDINSIHTEANFSPLIDRHCTTSRSLNGFDISLYKESLFLAVTPESQVWGHG